MYVGGAQKPVLPAIVRGVGNAWKFYLNIPEDMGVVRHGEDIVELLGWRIDLCLQAHLPGSQKHQWGSRLGFGLEVQGLHRFDSLAQVCNNINTHVVYMHSPCLGRARYRHATVRYLAGEPLPLCDYELGVSISPSLNRGVVALLPCLLVSFLVLATHGSPLLYHSANNLQLMQHSPGSTIPPYMLLVADMENLSHLKLKDPSCQGLYPV